MEPGVMEPMGDHFKLIVKNVTGEVSVVHMSTDRAHHLVGAIGQPRLWPTLLMALFPIRQSYISCMLIPQETALDVSASTAIQHVKAMVEARTGCPISRQR